MRVWCEASPGDETGLGDKENDERGAGGHDYSPLYPKDNPRARLFSIPDICILSIVFNFTSYKVHQIEVQEMRINDQRPKTLL